MDNVDNLPILKSMTLIISLPSIIHKYNSTYMKYLLSCKLIFTGLGIRVLTYLGNHYFVYHPVSVLDANEFFLPNGTLFEERVHIYLKRYVDTAKVIVTTNTQFFHWLSPRK